MLFSATEAKTTRINLHSGLIPKRNKTFFSAPICVVSECNSGFLSNHHLPPSLIHGAATADYLLIGWSLLTVTVTHPRCSACFTVFNSWLAEHNSACGCSDHFLSVSWAPADAAESLSTRSLRGRRVVSVRHGCPLLVPSLSVQLMDNNLQHTVVPGIFQSCTGWASVITTGVNVFNMESRLFIVTIVFFFQCFFFKIIKWALYC